MSVVKKDKQRHRSLVTATPFLQGLFDCPFKYAVVVGSCEGPVVSTVLNHATTVFFVEFDPKATWKALCLAADTMNIDLQGGDPPQAACSCTNNLFFLPNPDFDRLFSVWPLPSSSESLAWTFSSLGDSLAPIVSSSSESLTLTVSSLGGLWQMSV